MEAKERRTLAVGLAVGHGTGPELASVFEKVILQLASLCSLDIELRRPSRIYHSYLSLLSSASCQEEIDEATLQDATHYESFCKEEAARGTRCIFRTAITAESLYLVRQNLEAVKIERFDHGQASMLLVRDQAQGFYTGSNHIDKGIISRTCQFSKALTSRIISYSLERARQVWANATVDSVVLVYKHHLFSGIFDVWAREWSQEFSIKIECIQPDTVNRNLLAYGLQGRRLLITGNEYADIMQVFLLDMFRQGVQETTYAENVYLHPELHELSEYQTVHGSADDLTGKGIVNPTATIRAAAVILERHGGCRGTMEMIDGIIRTLYRKNTVTPDRGGNLSTAAFVDAILENVSPASSLSNGLQSQTAAVDEARLSMGRKTALIVIDFQNDFTTKENIAAEYIGDRIKRVYGYFRTQHQEVIFIRFLGDVKYQLPNWQFRNQLLGRPPHCLEDSSGAAFSSPVQPAAGERIFDKHAVFDAFLCNGFERYLHERGFEHLVLVGLYCDVCLDSTARTGFQKGYFITVVSDCTASLHISMEDSLAYMRAVYGARIVTHENILNMSV